MNEPKLTDERAKFEAWASDQGFPLRRFDDADYQDLRTQGPWEAWQARAAIPAVPAGKDAAALGYATRLATAIFEKHYSHEADYASGLVVWQPFDELLGVLTQIDNMTCGLVRPESPLAAIPTPPSAAQEVREVPPPGSSRRDVALALYKPPFKFTHGHIFDADGRMVADQDGGFGLDGKVETHIIARVRGWGRISYMKDAEQLQDEVGEMLAQALTDFWREAASKACGVSLRLGS